MDKKRERNVKELADHAHMWRYSENSNPEDGPHSLAEFILWTFPSRPNFRQQNNLLWKDRGHPRNCSLFVQGQLLLLFGSHLSQEFLLSLESLRAMQSPVRGLILQYLSVQEVLLQKETIDGGGTSNAHIREHSPNQIVRNRRSTVKSVWWEKSCE